MTHTHVGCKAHVGYAHSGSRLHGHRLPRSGSRHALCGGPGRFTSLCGETVHADADDEFGFPRLHGPTNVKPVCEGALPVTCKRCLKVLKTAK